VFVAGSSPATRTLVELAARLGYRTVAVLDDPSERIERDGGTISLHKLAATPMGREDAVVVGTMNRYDEAGLLAALETAAGYVGLIASGGKHDSFSGHETVDGLRDELKDKP
jgi:xanthine/CO dehydrogenase XdhC/CoxF family maturation factor